MTARASSVVLLLGRLPFDSEQWEGHVDDPSVQLRFGTSLDDVRRTFEAGPVNHVIMGAGLPVETRADIVRAVFAASDSTTMHMKDRASGKAGMVAFVRAILRGVGDP